jgi:hypothetical protein
VALMIRESITIRAFHWGISVFPFKIYLKNGHQPMHSADGDWTIIFNGEIYNHLDIRKEIESKYVFKSSGDTETLLYAFIEYGIDVLKRLNGIFSFAIFNHKLDELHIVKGSIWNQTFVLLFEGRNFDFRF